MEKPKLGQETILKAIAQGASRHFYQGTIVESAKNHNQIHLVNQGRWAGAAHIPEKTRWLATFGANPCFAVSIFDSANKRGALAHIDALSSPNRTLHNMRGAISYPAGIEIPRYSVHLVGGNMSPIDEMAEIVEVVDEIKKTGYDVELHIGDVRQKSASLALDLINGSIYAFKPDRILTSFEASSDMDFELRALQNSIAGQKQAAKPYVIIGF